MVLHRKSYVFISDQVQEYTICRLAVKKICICNIFQMQILKLLPLIQKLCFQPCKITRVKSATLTTSQQV